LGFNGIFSTNSLYHAFEKYIAVKKSEINTINNYSIWETFDTKDITKE